MYVKSEDKYEFRSDQVTYDTMRQIELYVGFLKEVRGWNHLLHGSYIWLKNDAYFFSHFYFKSYHHVCSLSYKIYLLTWTHNTFPTKLNQLYHLMQCDPRWLQNSREFQEGGWWYSLWIWRMMIQLPRVESSPLGRKFHIMFSTLHFVCLFGGIETWLVDEISEIIPWLLRHLLIILNYFLGIL